MKPFNILTLSLPPPGVFTAVFISSLLSPSLSLCSENFLSFLLQELSRALCFFPLLLRSLSQLQGLLVQTLPKRWQGCILLLILFLSDASDATDSNSSNLVGVFCVANSNAESDALREGLNWVCGPGIANCSAIQPNQPCYEDNNLVALASYAYNDYFHKMNASGGTCSFGNTASITNKDPSHGSCIFAGSMLQPQTLSVVQTQVQALLHTLI